MAGTRAENQKLHKMAEDIETFGDLAEVFKAMKSHGWGKEAVQYVLYQVWWEEESLPLQKREKDNG